MAQVEPMDIDAIDNDFDNKENAFQFNNVLSRTPCTEKGYEELDVSELNMKLRFSVTPASSPMSKSLTGPCLDNRNCNSDDYLNNPAGAENGNLTRSLNSSLTKPESLSKSKALPLQTLSTEPFIDSNRNLSMCRLLHQTDIDENLSLPSPCSSVPDTPEATTPTKEIPKPEGSPIMRGLKSVLSMFRPSQSPILPADDKSMKQEILSPVELSKSDAGTVQVSTPVAENKQKDAYSSKRSSPLKESMVFNEDLERELLWKDESTIIFKEERIPVHKLFFQNPIASIPPKTLNTTVEQMDISCNESVIADKSNTNIDPSDQFAINENALTGESDNEFLDCETTFTKNESEVKVKKELEMSNGVHIENITIDLSNNAEIPKEINPAFVNVIPEETNILTDGVSVSATDTISNINIIEATVNLLSSERKDYSKKNLGDYIDLKNKSEINMKLPMEDESTIICMDKKVIKDNYVTKPTEDQSSATLSMTCDDACTNDGKSKEIMNSEDSGLKLNSIDSYKNTTSESLHALETQEKNEIVADLPVTINIDINIDSSSSDNRTLNTQSVELTGTEPNIDKPNMSVELASLQYTEVESNTNLLTNNKDMKVVQNNDIPLDNVNLIGNVNNFEILEDMLEDHTINEHEATKKEELISKMKDSETPVDQENSCLADSSNNLKNDLNSNLNIIDSMPVSKSARGENEMPVDTIILPLLKDLNNTNSCSTVPIEASNVTMNVDLKSDFLEINRIQKSNDTNMEDILENKGETLKVKKNSEMNVELNVDDNIPTANINNTNLMVNNVSLHDCEAHELQIGSQATISQSPSEITLPDEDNIKHNILETIGMGNKDFNKQDITTFNRCDIDTNMNIECALVVDSTKRNQSKIKLNHLDQNDRTSVLNSTIESNREVVDNEALINMEINYIQTLNTQTVCVYEKDVETVEFRNENSEQDKGNFDLHTEENSFQTKENFSHDLETTYNEIDRDKSSSKAEINEFVVNKTLEDHIPSNTEQFTGIAETVIVNAENFSNLTTIDKAEDIITQEGVCDDIRKDAAFEKGADEMGEELITSANNSPYVSVTELDKIVEKIPNDTVGEIDIPLASNTKLPSSSPSSPKIVSKGYNFNFDEIDDPFATETKIRVSPTPDTPKQSFTLITEKVKTIQEVPKKANRRKSQLERKRPIQKKNINSTFIDKSTTKTTKESSSEDQINSAIITPIDNVLDNISDHVKDDISEQKDENSLIIDAQNGNERQKVRDNIKSVTSNAEKESSFVIKQDINSSDVEIKNIEQTLVISTQKSTSSSEQYFSLGTSSGESSSVMNPSKNVFNLPEIDDLNFNPFATKSKMRMSPPPTEKIRTSLEILNDTSNSSLIVQQPSDNYSTINKDMEHTLNKQIENDSLSNTSTTTFSSKNTNDIDTIVREIPTEDEDTVEGPFLEFDDSKDNQKVADVDIESDMMNFEEVPQQERDENLENGELFIDADAFEFLLNQNKSTTVLDSGKESLFLKFDPLFAKRVSSDGILAALSKVQKRQSTPKKITKIKQQDIIPIEKSTAGPSNKEHCRPIENFNDDLSDNVTKPMMVVSPAVSSVINQKKPITPKLNRRSLTFTSPAIAVIDRLLSFSGNSSHLEPDSAIPQTGREHSETDLAITQLRELLAEKEINVHTLRSESKELKDRLAALEHQVKGLETESAERLAKINELNERLLQKTKMNKSMAIVVEEYERTIASLIAETEHDKKRNAEERNRLIKERDEQTAHLTSMEVSFSDLHSKYEKSKQIILSCKANEDIYKKSMKEFQDNFSKMQNNYELLKQHATSKLNHANQELEKMNRAHEAEVIKMSAMLKRKELHITSLEETLAQKTKANEELTAICDELINKVG